MCAENYMKDTNILTSSQTRHKNSLIETKEYTDSMTILGLDKFQLGGAKKVISSHFTLLANVNQCNVSLLSFISAYTSVLVFFSFDTFVYSRLHSVFLDVEGHSGHISLEPGSEELALHQQCAIKKKRHLSCVEEMLCQHILSIRHSGF